MSDSKTTRFLLAGIGNFSEAKARVEGLKETMSGIADVNLGRDRWATFLHDPSTTDTQDLRNRLEAMNLRIIQTVFTEPRN